MATKRVASLASMLRRVAQLPRAAGGQRSGAAGLSQLAGSGSGRQGGHRALLGKNIFELRAAAVEAPREAGAAEEPIALPTSDESEQLLRIRHSVSVGARDRGQAVPGCLWRGACFPGGARPLTVRCQQHLRPSSLRQVPRRLVCHQSQRRRRRRRRFALLPAPAPSAR
jgi:hypothetical protein